MQHTFVSFLLGGRAFHFPRLEIIYWRWHSWFHFLMLTSWNSSTVSMKYVMASMHIKGILRPVFFTRSSQLSICFKSLQPRIAFILVEQSIGTSHNTAAVWFPLLRQTLVLRSHYPRESTRDQRDIQPSSLGEFIPTIPMSSRSHSASFLYTICLRRFLSSSHFIS